MNSKKILFNTWAGAFFQKGGGEVQLLKSKEALEKKGYKVDLYDQWNPHLNIDVFHQFSIELGVEHAVKKYKSLGYKVALSTIMWHPPERGSAPFYRIKSILDTSDILMTNSDMESKKISDHFEIDITKFHKTRNSISETYFTKGSEQAFREKTGIKGEFVLSVANIDQRKNTHKLIQACKDLGLPLVTIGHVKDMPYYSQFQDSYPQHTHLGPIEDEEFLKSAYSASSVFALPSLCETPGIAALEAASQGSKIVVTSEGCAQEYFGEMALYVDPESLKSIKDGIHQAMNSLKNSETPIYITRNYSWDITAEEIIEGYKKIP
jgi:glycosyltransferase involved in cell wall biosynthesis